MKFIVNSSALLKELQKLNGVISSNNTLPILDNFLFDISSNQMSIVASDLETTMISSISVESDLNFLRMLILGSFLLINFSSSTSTRNLEKLRHNSFGVDRDPTELWLLSFKSIDP